MSENPVRKYFKLLDAVLKAVYNNGQRQLSISQLDLEVEKIVNPVKKNQEDKRVAVYDMTYTTYDAVQYLILHGYIIELNPIYKLQFSGDLKLHSGGFESDYNRDLKESRRKESEFIRKMESYTSTWQFQLATIVIALISLVISIFK